MPFSEEEREVLRSADKARELMKSETWAFFEAVLATTIQGALPLLEQTDFSQEGLIREQYQKGTINGLRLAKGLFEATIQSADEIRAREAQARVDDSESEDEEDETV